MSKRKILFTLFTVIYLIPTIVFVCVFFSCVFMELQGKGILSVRVANGAKNITPFIPDVLEELGNGEYLYHQLILSRFSSYIYVFSGYSSLEDIESFVRPYDCSDLTQEERESYRNICDYHHVTGAQMPLNDWDVVFQKTQASEDQFPLAKGQDDHFWYFVTEKWAEKLPCGRCSVVGINFRSEDGHITGFVLTY